MADSTPSGYRWASITADDRSAILYIITFLGFIYTSLTFTIRVFIKWHTLGLDDGAMAIAQLMSVVQFALLLSSLSNGLGKSFDALSDREYTQMALTYYGNQITVYLCLGASKTATMLLVRRLFIQDMRKEWTTCNVILWTTFIWSLGSVLSVSAGCSTQSLSPKISSQACPGFEIRYMVVFVTDAITDLIIAVVPACLCCHLRMDLRHKLQILGIFSLRLPLLALAGLSFKFLVFSIRSKNVGVLRTETLVFQQTQLCVSLIVGTVPCLRSFLQSFDTGSGVKAGFRHASLNGYGHHSTLHDTSAYSNIAEHHEMVSHNKIGKAEGVSTMRIEHGEFIQIGRKMPNPEPRTNHQEQIVEIKRYNIQEPDRESQSSTHELVIRKDIRWEITRE